MTDQLTAIDDALETGAADHGDPLTRELQELALALRADAPEPDPEFRHELGRRVRSGFPKPATLRQPLWRRALTPAFATGLIAVPIVLIVIFARWVWRLRPRRRRRIERRRRRRRRRLGRPGDRRARARAAAE